MKALVLNSINNFSYAEFETPKCPDDGLLVKVKAVCICGSDAGAILGKNALFTYPRVLGHEVSGTVEKVGKEVKEFSEGDKVALLPCISCNNCRACSKGHTNACFNLKLYGVQVDGGLSQYLAAPSSNWIKIPNSFDFVSGAMIEPLAIGTHAIAKTNLQKGDNVLIIGAGPIGVSVGVNANIYRANVYLSDLSEKRRTFVEKSFGFKVLNPLEDDYLEQLKSITDGQLFDVVIDTTAVKQSMENCWRYITNSGKIVFVGICPTTLEIDGKGFHSKEPSLFVTRNSTRKDFEEVIKNIQNQVYKPLDFVTNRASFDKAKDEIVKWTNPQNGVFKGVVIF